MGLFELIDAANEGLAKALPRMSDLEFSQHVEDMGQEILTWYDKPECVQEIAERLISFAKARQGSFA